MCCVQVCLGVGRRFGGLDIQVGISADWVAQTVGLAGARVCLIE